MKIYIYILLLSISILFNGCVIKLKTNALQSLKLKNKIDARGCTHLSRGRVDNMYGFGDNNFRVNVNNKMLNQVIEKGGNAYVVHQSGVYNADFDIYHCPNNYDPEVERMIAYNDKIKYIKPKKEQTFTFNTDIQNLLLTYPATKVDNKKWLFIISIENYSDTDNVLYAKHSAEMFEKVAQKTLGISKRQTYSLINNRATSGRIKDSLQMLLAEVKQGDKIYFYYAGHGIPDPSDNGQPYILPSDKLPSYINQDKFFSLKNIYTMLDNSNATEVIAFVDSCFSGSTDGKSVLKGVASSRLVPKSITIDKTKMTVITAGSGTEFANMYEEKNHRLFSYYLMKSLLNGDKNIYTIYKKVSADVYHQSNIMGPLYRQEPVLQGSKNFEL